MSCSSCGSSCSPCSCGSRRHVPPPLPIIPVSGISVGADPSCGESQVIETLSAFVLPAVDASIPVAVGCPESWPSGFCVAISNGADTAVLKIVAVGSETITLQNDGAAGNPEPGTSFLDSNMVLIGKCPEAADSAGCQRGSWTLSEPFTVAGPGVNTTIFLEPCGTLIDGQNLFVEDAGWFTLVSTDAVTETGVELTVVQNRLLAGVTAGSTVIPSGNYVIPDEPQAAGADEAKSSFMVQNSNNGGSPGTSYSGGNLQANQAFTFGTTVFDRIDASVGEIGSGGGGTALIAAVGAIWTLQAQLHLEAPDSVTNPAGANQVKEPQCVFLRDRGGTLSVIGKGGGNQALSTDNILSASVTTELAAGDKVYVGWYDTGTSVWSATSGWPLQSPTAVEFSYFSGHLVALV